MARRDPQTQGQAVVGEQGRCLLQHLTHHGGVGRRVHDVIRALPSEPAQERPSAVTGGHLGPVADLEEDRDRRARLGGMGGMEGWERPL